MANRLNLVRLPEKGLGNHEEHEGHKEKPKNCF